MGRVAWRHVRRPREIVETTRWLFAVLALVSLLLALPAPMATATATMRIVALLSALTLILSLSSGYLRRSVPLWMDAIDTVAILAFALTGPAPEAAFAFVFAALWFRSLYGSTRRGVLRCGLYVGALAASVLLWRYVPGHVGGTPTGPLFGVPPSMLLTVIVGRHLARTMQSMGHSVQLDAIQASMGSQLLRVTDAGEVRQIAWMAIGQICAASPGLRVLKLVRDGRQLRVDAATDGFPCLPVTLPAEVLTVLDVDQATGGAGARRHTELDAAAGVPCAWVCLPLPFDHDEPSPAWLLLGAPGSVPGAATAAIRASANQVTLALRNCQVHEQLTGQAMVDSLTGLANRTSFNAALAAVLYDDSTRHTTVLFIDLDDFKDVNDAFGHRAGDEVLGEVAARLRKATRPGDLCARIGGDEFAVLLRETPEGSAPEVAQRIVTTVAAPVHFTGGVAHIGASVGVATATADTNLEQLIHCADVAMYAAKANGKHRMEIFEPGLLRVDSSQVVFERQLAMAAGNGELVVHYQPVLSLPDGRCTAVEALVRWQHPQRGLLHPASFIEAAEQIGAIGDIGAVVLRRACADVAVWRDAHPRTPLALHVNISALQLHDSGFIDNVTRCINDFGLPPDRLVLEVTETIVINSPVAIDRLNVLAAHGIRIAIDDFGTGHSALTTLRSLPAQIVKIDKSFVAGCVENMQDRVVIEAVVNMAAQMGMRTIAEGVERPEQQSYLEMAKADEVQGYLYLRPTTAPEFGVWLDQHLGGHVQTGDSSDTVIPFTPRRTA